MRRGTNPRDEEGSMATISQPRDLFVTELQSMLYVEQKLEEQVLPELEQQAKNAELKEGFRHHRDETRRHVENLERAFELLGEPAKADKSHAIDGLIAQHDKVVKNIESDQLRDLFNAGAAAKTEHLEIAAYESLITSAEALGEDEIASLLEENLDQEKHTLQEVSKLSDQLTRETAAA
jgi:ferritin-like metal-binding protein YciE